MIHSWFPFNIVFFFRPPKSMKLDVIIARRIEVKNGVCGGQPSISWSRELQYISSNSMGSKTSLMMSFKYWNHVGVWRRFHERCEVEDQIASASLLLLSFYFSRFHKITKQNHHKTQVLLLLLQASYSILPTCKTLSKALSGIKVMFNVSKTARA